MAKSFSILQNKLRLPSSPGRQRRRWAYVAKVGGAGKNYRLREMTPGENQG